MPIGQERRRIFCEYLSGSSCKRIAKGLEADGIRNGAGSTRWWDSNIFGILTNEKYMGDALLQKTFTVDPLEKRRLPNRGDRPQYYVEGCLEPIVSRDVFLQVQDEMSRRSSMLTDDGACLHRSYNALSGLVVCGECGKPFRRIHWNNRGCRSIVWRCRTRLTEGKTECPSRTVLEEDLKKAVMDAVNEVFSDRDAIASVLRQNLSRMIADTTDSRVDSIQKRLDGLQKQIVEDPTKEAAVGEKILKLREEKEAIYVEHSKIEATKSMVKGFLQMLGDFKLDEYSDDLTRTFIKTVKVFPVRFEVVFRTGIEVEVS